MELQIKINFAIFYVMIIFVFSLIHFKYKDAYHNIHDMTDAIYFSTITMTTTGFGDMYPIKRHTKIITTAQMMIAVTITMIIIISPVTYYEVKI